MTDKDELSLRLKKQSSRTLDMYKDEASKIAKKITEARLYSFSDAKQLMKEITQMEDKLHNVGNEVLQRIDWPETLIACMKAITGAIDRIESTFSLT